MTPRPSPLIGALQLAQGRPQGFAWFEGTPRAFIVSLLPWFALLAVSLLLHLRAGRALQGVETVLQTVVALLAPAVLSHVLARRWGREEHWLRYAIASNWCQWAMPAVFLLLSLVFWAGRGFGLPPVVVLEVSLLATGAYGLWLLWVLARYGLALSGGRAAWLVLLVNLGTGVLVLGPALLGELPANGSTP